MAQKSKKFRFTRKLALLSAVAVLIIAAVGLGYWHYHKHPSQVIIPVAPAKNTAPQPSSSNGSSSTSSTISDKQAAPAGGYSGGGGKGSGPSNGTGQPPLAPTGPFVSNHGGDSSHPAAIENSVCNTTPGATCYIQFTKGSSTATLQAGTADSNGSVFWNGWNVSSYLSSGTWTVSAVAQLNGDTVNSSNNETLTVQ